MHTTIREDRACYQESVEQVGKDTQERMVQHYQTTPLTANREIKKKGLRKGEI